MLAIVVQTFVTAPAEEVWAQLHARADILLDALPVTRWPAARDEQPPRHLSVAFPAGRVHVTLHDVGGGVRVDLRHDGWPETPEAESQVQGHFAGWLQGLAALGHFVETGQDPRLAVPGERYFISGEIPASADAVYRVLVDHAPITDRVEGRMLRWKQPGGGDVVALLRPTPRGTHLALAEYGVAGREASQRWPGLFEQLARQLG